MATTEITKILFRRGSSDDRFDLEALGGLAQGEPGFTSSGGGLVNDKYNQASAFLHPDDATQHAVGDGSGGTNGGSTRAGGGDFFVGGGGTADIFIGGTSAETHWQRYFVSRYGTGFNHDGPGDGDYIDGSLTIGESGRTTAGTRAANRESQRWDLTMWGEDTDNVKWITDTGEFNINTDAALRVPVGTISARPQSNDASGTGTSDSGTALQGHIRYNTTDSTYEGYDGTVWGSLGGVSDVLNQTYITVHQDQPAWSNGSQAGTFPSGANTRGEAGIIKFVVGRGTPRIATLAGGFDNAMNFYVTQDIVAFSSSDERQKDNIRVIEGSTEKLMHLRGVEFDWNDNGPAWVGEDRADVGLLAQEVEAVLPQAVSTRDDGYKAVDYKKVIPLLVETIKELTMRVEQLEQQ